MLSAVRNFRCRRHHCQAGSFAAATLLIWLGVGGQVLAQPPYDNEQTPEGWAWAQIKQRKDANFNIRCGSPELDPSAESETRWTESCRRLSAAFLVDVLTHDPWRKQVPYAGVNIIGARIQGDIDLRSAKLDRAFIVDNSRIENDINLTGARTDSVIGFVGSRVAGDVRAELFHAELSLRLYHTKFNKGVRLNNAKIDRNLILDGAALQGDLNAAGLQVGATLFMRSSSRFKASFKEVGLRRAKVTGRVEMNEAAFDGELEAEALQVGDSLLMLGVTGAKPIRMQFARIGGNLDIRHAILAELDLSGASVAGEFSLGRSKTMNDVFWRIKEAKPGDLILRNARVASLVDTKDAWPISGHLHLDGFAFTRLGVFAGDTGREMRARGMDWWDGWARRDSVYSPTPYEQVAAALMASGDRSAADEIRFLGRARQHQSEEDWWPWIFSGFLRFVAGFGIGDYTFRVLYWVVGITAAGAAYLWTCVPAARAHGLVWCSGASLNRLLPVIEINKEFSDFFDDPNRVRLTARQSVVFSVIAMVGWVLGAILIAAISGLTQKL
jgi:hypothetical protein